MHKQLENISIDDAVLIRRCKHGDRDAMERLKVKYQNRIYNVILKICANKDDAAELTQETFVKVIEKIGSFRQKSTFYTWLFRVAVNLTLNYCKRKMKVPMQSLDASVGPEFESARGRLKNFLVSGDGEDPVSLAENRELGEILLNALGRLDGDQRAVVVLRDIEQMSYAQIAGALEIELGTVKSRLSRARANLREILETVIQ